MSNAKPMHPRRRLVIYRRQTGVQRVTGLDLTPAQRRRWLKKSRRWGKRVVVGGTE